MNSAYAKLQLAQVLEASVGEKKQLYRKKISIFNENWYSSF